MCEDLQAGLALARAGDLPARERLAQLLRPRIQIMLRVRLGPDQDRWNLIEDLTQDILLAVHEGLPGLRTDSLAAFRLYLSTVVRNKAVDHIRHERRHRRPARPNAPPVTQTAGSAIGVLQSLYASSTSPSKQASRSERIEFLMAEIADLPTRQRDALTMAFFDELETTHIGEQLGITRAAAAMLILRGIRALRDRWVRDAREPA